MGDLKIPSYGRIPRLGNKEATGVFLGEISVQEKYDGSQITFGIVDGEVVVQSRKIDVTNSPDKRFRMIAARIKRMDLPDNAIMRGEFLYTEKHNRIKYGRIPLNNIVVFDVFSDGYCPPQAVINVADFLGFEPVKELYRGPGEDCPDIEELTQQPSSLGGAMEGVVIKNLTNGRRAKYVRKEFQEVTTPREKKPNEQPLEYIASVFQNEARWRKAVEHLRDEELLVGNQTDIGLLIRELHRDFDEECVDEAKDLLWAAYRKHLLKRITVGFADWYGTHGCEL